MAISQSQSHAKYIKTEIRQQKLMSYWYMVCVQISKMLCWRKELEMRWCTQDKSMKPKLRQTNLGCWNQNSGSLGCRYWLKGGNFLGVLERSVSRSSLWWYKNPLGYPQDLLAFCQSHPSNIKMTAFCYWTNQSKVTSQNLNCHVPYFCKTSSHQLALW